MKASELKVGMVVDQPDYRGYRIVKVRNPGISGYLTLYLISVHDHHDRLTWMVTTGTEVKVIG